MTSGAAGSEAAAAHKVLIAPGMVQRI